MSSGCKESVDQPPDNPTDIQGLSVEESNQTQSSYIDIRIADDDWLAKIQDNGCAEKDLPAKRYKLAKILSVGPKGGEQTYYYNLTSIAVDYVKKMVEQKTNGIAWFKLPKSLPNVKVKIVEIILQLRVLESTQYERGQNRLINFLHNVWGSSQGSITPHDNDKIRLFGLIMAVEKNRPKLQRLAEGHKDWSSMDDPTLSSANIFRSLSFDFANEEIVIELPDNAGDIQGIDDLDPNDKVRMGIERDGES